MHYEHSQVLPNNSQYALIHIGLVLLKHNHTHNLNTDFNDYNYHHVYVTNMQLAMSHVTWHSSLSSLLICLILSDIYTSNSHGRKDALLVFKYSCYHNTQQE